MLGSCQQSFVSRDSRLNAEKNRGRRKRLLLDTDDPNMIKEIPAKEVKNGKFNR